MAKRTSKLTDAQRWRVLTKLKWAEYEKLSGRKRHDLRPQSTTWNIPFGKSPINLQEVIRGFHDLLSRNRSLKAKMGPGKGGDEDLTDEDRRWRAARAEVWEIRAARDAARVVDREELHKWLAQAGQVLREASETLQRQFGEEAALVLAEAVEEFERELEAFYARSLDGAADIEPDPGGDDVVAPSDQGAAASDDA